MSRTLGAVLAGGRSSRFGSDKARALWAGRPLLEHAIEALRPVVDDIVICGRSHAELPGLPDRPAPDMGPLGGLAAALHHADRNGFDAVLSVGCDTPLLPRPLLERLCLGTGPAFLADLPVIGWWPARLAPYLDDFLAEQRRHSIRSWAALAGAVPLVWSPLPNVNAPADLGELPAWGTGTSDQN